MISTSDTLSPSVELAGCRKKTHILRCALTPHFNAAKIILALQYSYPPPISATLARPESSDSGRHSRYHRRRYAGKATQMLWLRLRNPAITTTDQHTPRPCGHVHPMGAGFGRESTPNPPFQV